ALVTIREDGKRPRRLDADDPPLTVLAHREPALRIEGETVAPGLLELGDVHARVTALRPEDRHLSVAGPPVEGVFVRVTEEQVSVGAPDRPLGEGEPRRELLRAG